jgi:hypothetical protein
VLLVTDNEAMLARAGAALSPACEIVGSVKNGAAALVFPTFVSAIRRFRSGRRTAYNEAR